MKKADERVEHLFESVNSYRGKWGVLGGAMLLSIVIQMGGIFANVLLGHAIGLETRNGWLDYLVIVPAISLISMNPLSVNGPDGASIPIWSCLLGRHRRFGPST